jgi:hypothetical protein
LVRQADVVLALGTRFSHAAHQPLVIEGGDVTSTSASELVQLAERLHLPVAVSFRRFTAFPTNCFTSATIPITGRYTLFSSSGETSSGNETTTGPGRPTPETAKPGTDSDRLQMLYGEDVWKNA